MKNINPIVNFQFVELRKSEVVGQISKWHGCRNSFNGKKQK